MKYLLTSGGVQNASIHQALLEMLGKPIENVMPLQSRQRLTH
ncbi:hypothetical protein [Exiguobacterium sp.]|nr:hypothetical protein [Exiguobacterium sp.]